MTPELNEDEMRLLHKEAMELYDLYFKPDAKHKIGVGEHIAKEIFSSNNENIFEIYFRLFFKHSTFLLMLILSPLICVMSLLFSCRKRHKRNWVK